jgi:hypothetical protein
MPEDDVAGMTQLVPELYYDLIARIPAGLMFWLLVLVWWFERRGLPSALKFNEIPIAILFILLLLASYVVAIVISPLGGLFGMLQVYATWRYVHRVYGQELTALFGLLRPSALDREGNLRQFAELHLRDFEILHLLLHQRLKHVDAQARALLPKIRAEAALCENLATALMLFASIFVWVERRVPGLTPSVLFASAIVLTLISGAKRYVGAVVVHLAYASTHGLCKSAA